MLKSPSILSLLGCRILETKPLRSKHKLETTYDRGLPRTMENSPALHHQANKHQKKKKIQVDSSLLLGERQEHGKRPGKAENIG